MKNKLCIVAFLSFGLPLSAAAGSVSLSVGEVQGEMEALGQLSLVTATASLTCHFKDPNGRFDKYPTKRLAIDWDEIPSHGHRYKMRIAAGSLNFWAPSLDLMSCWYTLHLSGEDAETGSRPPGDLILAKSSAEDRHPIWKDRSALTRQISRQLQPLRLVVEKTPYGAWQIRAVD